ncbi:transferrin receptor 1b [Centroberyx gerrardi]|uniref:transferrin receptor 1b n=1 Tax=Centroberyx gerrardi TaxID=166262 RepID=UPI003AAA5C55
MDLMRSAINNVFNSEQYSRFTMQPDEEGGSHVEVKLSDDGIDDATEVAHQPRGSPCFRPLTQKQRQRNACYVALGVLLLVSLGYMLGYVSHRARQQESATCPPEQEEEEEEKMPVAAPDVPLDWAKITSLLTQKLTSQAFNKTLSDFDLGNRSAGSAADMNLANQIFKTFKTQEMEPWTDIHYVQLQTADSKRPNRVLFGSDEFQPKGYLAYSATGTAKGKIVYGNYGRQEDLKVLQNNSIELKGCVMLLRAGRISFAQQVANAAEKGAAAVLIYPDTQDYKYQNKIELYGHVHLGSGDPYTPGFPSFNHTQFPPTQSSGLPTIPAQTITAQMAATILQKIGGPEPVASSGFKGGMPSVPYTLGGSMNITVEVNNVLVNREIHNVFGVIKGFTDPDRYVVLGAQRDAWGQGYARANVGTTILTELAKAVHEMVEKDGFRPRRSLVFASWAAGEYGNVGATEWLEAYMSSLDKRVLTYISLDGAVMGRGGFMASSSPLLHSLLESTMKEVKSPLGSGSMYDMVGRANWEINAMRPMAMEDPAYPFLAFSGIPSVSFHFITPNVEAYPYYGTNLDNMDHLGYETNHHTGEMAAVAGQFAGQMALRLAHDHLIRLDVQRYSRVITSAVAKLTKHINKLSKSDGVSPSWLARARGSFMRAAAGINNAITSTDINDKEACRILNERTMKIEHSLLSPYVSPKDTPFRHLLLGRGSHTLAAISETTDMVQLRTQLALATWTLQGCANAMVGDIWDIDNQI